MIPCALIAYSSFSDAYETIMYNSNFSALRTEKENVSCEIFAKIGSANDSYGFMKTIVENKKKNSNINYLFYPYVVSSKTEITSSGCKKLCFILIPYNSPKSVIGFVEGGLFEKNKMVVIPMKENIDIKNISKIDSYKDIIDENKMVNGAKIFFSGELNNKILNSEYSYLLPSSNKNDVPDKKIGFTVSGNFSLNTKFMPCVKDYCNFFFLPIDPNANKIGKIEELNKGNYNYAGTVKMAGVISAISSIASAVKGQSSSGNLNDIKIKESKLNSLPICFGYKNMPMIMNQNGGEYKHKLLKYIKKNKAYFV